MIVTNLFMCKQKSTSNDDTTSKSLIFFQKKFVNKSKKTDIQVLPQSLTLTVVAKFMQLSNSRPLLHQLNKFFFI